MSRIFLSHSSANNAEAIALRDWLVAEGWNDLFLDLDPERGLKAGERWQEALRQAAHHCELVICLISPAWAASKWCLAEFLLAKSINKRIFGVIVEPTPFASMPIELTSEWQLVDLTAGSRDYLATITLPPGGKSGSVSFAGDGLDRLRIGIRDAGLDPKHFKWPPEHDLGRAPYRGLRPLEADDAGIFFGREAPIIEAIDRLRGLTEAAPPRLMVVLGASGAGKSSFLRAGLLPRLGRNPQTFLPLPCIRPERAAINGETGLISALAGAFRTTPLKVARGDVREAVGGGAPKLKPLLTRLVSAAQPPVIDDEPTPKPPTLVLAIDQGEELFLAEAQGEAQPFLALLRDLVVADAPRLIAVFTMRSDNYERLQSAPELDGVHQETLSLPPMPKGSFAEVVKGPIRRLDGTSRAIRMDDALVDALLSDIEAGGAKDALPLLAFTLERLYDEYGATGHLTLEHFNKLSGVEGSIEAAVERAFAAADNNSRIPRDRNARLTLLRRGLIPWLAGIDPETGAPRRRVARLSEIPAESRPLIDLLVEQRLLSTDVAKDTGETTIEPAHEALLRQWGLLQGWLTEDFGLLSVLDGLKRATRDWAANARDQSWLSHKGVRLSTAEHLTSRPDLAANLHREDLAYLAACRLAEKKRRSRARRVGLLVLALLLLLITSAIAFLQRDLIMDYAYWHWILRGSALSAHAEAELARRPGTEFSECAHGCPIMVTVPPGEFLMGSPEGIGAAIERPRHLVLIQYPFAVSRHPITFDEWKLCVDSDACDRANDAGWGQGWRPVINVNWHQAQQYVHWLSRISGRPYRLLSEAEWEYAARAGTSTSYPWGDTMQPGKANCSGCGGRWDGKQTAPVGSFFPNAFGLYDMHGNVSQWVADCPGKYENAPRNGSADQSGECSSRAIRGGSWHQKPDAVRSASREWYRPAYRDSGTGFRIARTLNAHAR